METNQPTTGKEEKGNEKPTTEPVDHITVCSTAGLTGVKEGRDLTEGMLH